MNVELPITYRHRGRSGSRRYTERVVVPILELTDEEAPVAVEWRQGATRWFGGHHYLAVATPFEEGMSDGERVRAARDFFVMDGCLINTDTSAYVDTRKTRGSARFSAARHPQVVDCLPRLKAHENAGFLSRDCIAVGNQLWFRCGEPRLVASPRSRFLPPMFSVDTWHTELVGETPFAGRRGIKPTALRAVYSVRVDMPEAVGEIVEGATASADSKGLRVLVRESIRRDDPTEVISETASALVGELEERKLLSVHDDLALRFVRPIADYLENLDGDEPDCDHLADMIDTVRRFLKSESHSAFELLTLAMSRWEDRPLSVEFSERIIPSSRT